MAAKKKVSDGPVELRRLARANVIVPIRGITPYISHAWSEKSINMMRNKVESEAMQAAAHKPPKNPEEEYQSTIYRLEDGSPGIPSNAFKAAIVSSARLFADVSMVALKTMLFVHGEGPNQLVRLRKSNSPDVPTSVMRVDTPRNTSGTCDVRYRAMFEDWGCDLQIEFLPSMISVASVLSLVEAAGDGGVGDWRPSAPKANSGTFGRFRIDVSNVQEVAG